MFRYLCNQKAALLTAILLMAAGVLTLCFPEFLVPAGNRMAAHSRKRNYRDTRRPLRPDMEPGQQNAVCRDRPPLLDGGAGHGRERAAGDTVRRRSRF